MKYFNFFFYVMTSVGLIYLTGCSDDDDESTPAFTLKTLVATGADVETGENVSIDLNGTTVATGVPTNPTITATFSKDVDGASVSTTSFSLTAGGTSIPVTVTASGAEVILKTASEIEKGTEYKMVISGAVKAKDGGAFTSVSRTFFTGGVGTVTPPQVANQTHFWAFDGNTDDADGTKARYESTTGLSYVPNRHGEANAAIAFAEAEQAGQGAIVELSDSAVFFSSITYSFWVKVNKDDYVASSRFVLGLGVHYGYFLEFGPSESGDSTVWVKGQTYHKLAEGSTNKDSFAHEWGLVNGDGQTGGKTTYEWSGSLPDLLGDNEWHHFVLSYDSATSIKTFYVDGERLIVIDLDKDSPLTDPNAFPLKELHIASAQEQPGIDPVLTVGWACSRANTATSWALYDNGANTFKGSMDDLRLFSVGLTDAEVKSLYNAERPK